MLELTLVLVLVLVLGVLPKEIEGEQGGKREEGKGMEGKEEGMKRCKVSQ